MHYEHGWLLTELECDTLIKDCERIGFQESPIGRGTTQIVKEIRNNSRLILNANDVILKRLEDYLLDKLLVPKEYKGMKFSRLNDVFRVYKYTDGQYFRSHRDDSIVLDNEETQLTILIYLNTCASGATVVYPYGISQVWRVMKMKCARGAVLVFDHDLWHEGEEVINETKYVLRTDAFYFKDTNGNDNI